MAVHVAYWDLARQRERLGELGALLSRDERARAQRLVLTLQQERFVLARGLLRETLAAATGAAAATLTFTRGVEGKPALAGGGLEFSLSQAGEGLLVALSRDAAVGCDLESLRPVPQALDIARRWFSPVEHEALAGLGGATLDRAFLSCWVRKEAALKALGTGLQTPLDFVAGFARADGEERCLRVAGRDLWLADLPLPPGWVGAVAAERPLEVLFSATPFPGLQLPVRGG